MVLLAFLVVGGTATCSTAIKRGPYVLKKPFLNMTVPTKHKIIAKRITVVKDVELAVMYRSYWSSYCYSGGNIDPNTGCFRGITQDLPSYIEAMAWASNQTCLVGKDCTDCYGSDSDACLDPKKDKVNWVEHKELHQLENNNHIFRHTCNLSWRCGIHKAKFPTFLTKRNESWIPYTIYNNGTEFDIEQQSYWLLEDLAIVKTRAHQLTFTNIELSCFLSTKEGNACFDQETGIFFEIKASWYCFERVCYEYVMDHVHDMNLDNNDDLVDLQDASIEDVKMVLAEEKLLSEEMRYNFGKLSEEVFELRKILSTVILSVAKIDDRLLGNVLGHSARSQFLGIDEFFLFPCSEPEPENSNCFKGLIFKNGRWINQTDPTECMRVNEVQQIDPFMSGDLWFPKMVDQEILGTTENLEGWSYYAKERESLDKAMKWTGNAQQYSSIGDLFDLPKGLVSMIFSGFFTAHLVTYLILGVLFCKLYRSISSNGDKVNINMSGMRRNSSKPNWNDIAPVRYFVQDERVVIPSHSVSRADLNADFDKPEALNTRGQLTTRSTRRSTGRRSAPRRMRSLAVQLSQVNEEKFRNRISTFRRSIINSILEELHEAKEPGAGRIVNNSNESTEIEDEPRKYLRPSSSSKRSGNTVKLNRTKGQKSAHGGSAVSLVYFR